MPTCGRAKVPTQGERGQPELGHFLLKIFSRPSPSHDSMHGCRRRLLTSHSTLPPPSQTQSYHLALLDPNAPKPGPSLSGFTALLGTACVHDMKPKDAVSLPSDVSRLHLIILLVIPKATYPQILSVPGTRDTQYSFKSLDQSIYTGFAFEFHNTTGIP